MVRSASCSTALVPEHHPDARPARRADPHPADRRGAEPDPLIHLHSGFFEVLAQDGHRLPAPYEADTVVLGVGQTYDLLFIPTRVGAWMIHCHIFSHSETRHGMTGMVTFFDVYPANSVVTPAVHGTGTSPRNRALALMRRHCARLAGSWCSGRRRSCYRRRASAHAELDSTSPRAGQVLAHEPASIDLHFSDAVDLSTATVAGVRTRRHAG